MHATVWLLCAGQPKRSGDEAKTSEFKGEFLWVAHDPIAIKGLKQVQIVKPKMPYSIMLHLFKLQHKWKTIINELRFVSDVNECENVSQHQCAHRCVNTLTSYYCECNPGYTLMPNKKGCRGCPLNLFVLLFLLPSVDEICYNCLVSIRCNDHCFFQLSKLLSSFDWIVL